MTLPEKCSHGVRLRGPNPPRCVGCDIVWATERLEVAKWNVLHYTKMLKELREEQAEKAAKA